MNKVWFFIANPKTINNWYDTKDPKIFERNEKGYISWGIPDKSRDIDNQKKVDTEDVILCYHAVDREIIGCCKCKGTHCINVKKTGFRNRIYINDVNFMNPISLDDLKKERFEFINEYLEIPRGRSVVPVPKKDWEIFKKKWNDYHKC